MRLLQVRLARRMGAAALRWKQPRFGSVQLQEVSLHSPAIDHRVRRRCAVKAGLAGCNKDRMLGEDTNMAGCVAYTRLAGQERDKQHRATQAI